MNEVLMRVQDLSKHFTIDTDWLGKPVSVLKAVDEVSLTINKGEAFGLVGESGCGKTTLGKILVNLYSPTSGKIFLRARNCPLLIRNSAVPIARISR